MAIRQSEGLPKAVDVIFYEKTSFRGERLEMHSDEIPFFNVDIFL
jgi:hypothetical protein